MDGRIQAAVKKSYLAALAPQHINRFTELATIADVPAGIVVPGSVDPPKIGLIAEGLIRVYVSAPDGRQLTIGYARSGDVLGTSQIFDSGGAQVSGHVLIASIIVTVEVAVMRNIAEADASAACLVAGQIARELNDAVTELQFNSFANLRQRIARHLLGVATPEAQSPALTASATQDEIANAVGSSREAVARVMREMRSNGLVATSPGRVDIIDPFKLSEAARLRGNQ